MATPKHQLNIDIETRSGADLPKVGVYKYTENPLFAIILFAYAIDGGEVQLIDLTKQDLPRELTDMLRDPGYQKVAFNAQFERISLTRYMRKSGRLAPESWLDPTQWRDTMIEANEMGLPATLKWAATYLGLDEQKDTRGKALINFFSKPKRGGGFNQPGDDPEKWETFSSYNMQDVRTEMAIADKLASYPMHPQEWQYWSMDQRINDRGVMVDTDLAEGAIALMQHNNEAGMAQMRELTGLSNPNSLIQFKGWLHDQGYPMPKLGKELVQDKLDNDNAMPDQVRQALKLKLTLSNTSTKKYEMMERAHTNDGRLHGLLQFYGANRTGRWAGRLLQVQNLPRNYVQPLSLARDLVIAQDAESIELLFGSVPGLLKELIRTALIPEPGSRFLVADFSAIEARVIAWYAHEDWTLEAFRTHGKIYEATASQMFNIPLDQIDKKTRQKGKVATLALGYQGGPGALTAMGALKMGIPEGELPELVDKWRNANPNIVQFWYAVDRAATRVVRRGGVETVGPLSFYVKDGWLFIKLPSGRSLAYAHARMEPGKFADQIVYDGQGDRVGFTKLHTYGGKLVENIVQATARDLLAGAMLSLEKAGYPAVFHIHDEVIVEKPEGEGSLDEMVQIMTQVPDWAEGLPLNAAGFETHYYMKN